MECPLEVTPCEKNNPVAMQRRTVQEAYSFGVRSLSGIIVFVLVVKVPLIIFRQC